MGGGHYDEDIALEARSSNRDVFTYRGYGSAQEATAHRGVHPILNPFGKIRECMNETPIVVAMDVTRSRGDDTKIIYDKLPMFMGQIEMRNYVPSPAISFAAIGDANSDQAPLQVGQFEANCQEKQDSDGEGWLAFPCCTKCEPNGRKPGRKQGGK